MGKNVRAAKMDKAELERIRQEIDKIGVGTAGYGKPLSKKFQETERAKKKGEGAK